MANRTDTDATDGADAAAVAAPAEEEKKVEAPKETPKSIFGAVVAPVVEEEKKEEEKKPNLFGGIASALKKSDTSANTSGGFSFNFGGGGQSQPAPSTGGAPAPFSFAGAGAAAGGGFGALAKTAEDGKPAFSGGFAFANKGQSLFGNANKDDEQTEGADADPYFEPIVKLDEVEVKTGEEGLEVVFKERAKLFRWNDDQWKQRGIGECKILKDPETGKGRLLLRRDQVHKLACNHFIQPEMNLIPMKADAKSVTWVAMDNADGEAQLEKFAIKFKNEQLAADFTAAFNQMKDGKSAPKITAVKVDQNKGGFSFGLMKKTAPKDETPGEMVARLESEKMNADIAKATASGKFTFGAAAPSALTSSTTKSNNTGFGGFGGFGGASSGTGGTTTSFSFGVSTAAAFKPTTGGFVNNTGFGAAAEDVDETNDSDLFGENSEADSDEYPHSENEDADEVEIVESEDDVLFAKG